MAVKKDSRKNTKSKKGVTKPVATEDTCFIIMPFGSWFDYYFEAIYVPAIKSAGLMPRRADDLYRPSALVNDIWTLTQNAKVILADLSGKNPNVFYELGLAHALAKPAILVTESMDDIPFDLRALRVIVYDKNEPNWGDVLREKIGTAIGEVLDSPLEAVLPPFLKVKKSASRATVTKAEKELISLKQDIDLVKRELQLRVGTSPQDQVEKWSMNGAAGFAIASLKDNRSEDYIMRELIAHGIRANSARDILKYARLKVKAQESQSPGDVTTTETKNDSA